MLHYHNNLAASSINQAIYKGENFKVDNKMSFGSATSEYTAIMCQDKIFVAHIKSFAKFANKRQTHRALVGAEKDDTMKEI